jgi:phage head maturation protease
MSELINFGSTIKNLGGGKIGGHLVLFGSTNALDLDGEYFAADTNFDIEDGDRRSGYYDHGLDLELGNMKIGTGTLKKDSKGVWLEAQLDTRKAYVEDVLKLVDAGAVGFSSGAVAPAR